MRRPAPVASILPAVRRSRGSGAPRNRSRGRAARSGAGHRRCPRGRVGPLRHRCRYGRGRGGLGDDQGRTHVFEDVDEHPPHGRFVARVPCLAEPDRHPQLAGRAARISERGRSTRPGRGRPGGRARDRDLRAGRSSRRGVGAESSGAGRVGKSPRSPDRAGRAGRRLRSRAEADRQPHDAPRRPPGLPPVSGALSCGARPSRRRDHPPAARPGVSCVEPTMPDRRYAVSRKTVASGTLG